MMKNQADNTTTSKACVTMLLRGLMMAALLTQPAIVHAQAAPVNDRQPGQETVLDEIVVTGSRIARANQDAPYPLSVVDEDLFNDSGALVIAEALNQLPQLGNALEGGTSINALNNGFGVGTQTANLRNLGANRTLVLVNGRRHVGGDVGTTAVDLATIPSGMIERVDLVTGAASSVYGADAVTGVINVILKENFEGSRLTMRGAGTDEGGGDEYAFSGTHGGLFDGGDYVIGVEYSHQGKILGADTGYAVLDGSPATGLADASAGSGVNPGGLFAGAPGGLGGFNEGGDFTQPFAERFQRMPYRSLQNETQRLILSGRLGYDLSDTITTFLEVSYANTKVEVDIEPQFAVFSNGGFASQGTAGFRFPTAPVAAVPAVGAGLRAITRRFLEFGSRSSEIDRDLFRVALGFDADIGFADAHVNYQYGRIEAEQTDFQTIDKLKLLTAIDPVSCASTPGCAFVDIYGRNTIDPASEAFVSEDLASDSRGEQHVLSAWVSGDAFEFFGNSIGFVLGAEYRDESAVIAPNPALNAVIDPVTGSGNPVGLQGTRTFFGTTKGSYDVVEGFGEVSVPLGDSADVGVSARVSDYSTVGVEFTWGVNGQWRAHDALTLRGSVGKATRAPNVQQLFAPDNARTSQIVDPCDTLTDDGEALTQSAGCSPFVGSAFNPTDFDSNIRAVSGGNPDLDSESADTYTVGAVFMPIENAILSVDYFNIDMEDVLAPAFAAQATVDNCIATGNDFFCGNVTRDPVTGFVTSVRSEQVNLASESVAGLEFTLRSQFQLGRGRVAMNGIYTWLLERDRRVNDTSAVEDLRGRIDNIEDKFNVSLSYEIDRFMAGTMVRHVGSGVQSVSADPGIAIGNGVRSITYLDFFGRWSINDRLAVRVGVENATDEKAPTVTSLYEGIGAGDAIAPGLYDVRGRFLYGSIELSLQ